MASNLLLRCILEKMGVDAMPKIMIVDDEKILCECLKCAIELNGAFEVISCAQDGYTALEELKHLEPDLILMDISMPGINGIETTRLIKETNNSVKIIMLTGETNSEFLQEALTNGADGFVMKNIGYENLVRVIESAFDGMDIVQKETLHFDNSHKTHEEAKSNSNIVLKVNGIEVTLTPREIEIIAMIADAKTYDEIGKKLYLAAGRVRNIVTDVISRLMLKDKTQLVVYAIRNKLI